MIIKEFECTCFERVLTRTLHGQETSIVKEKNNIIIIKSNRKKTQKESDRIVRPCFIYLIYDFVKFIYNKIIKNLYNK